MSPRSLDKLIRIAPDICHGRPCFTGTRILVADILELLGAGVSPTEIVSQKYFPRLTPRHIQAALNYAAELVNHREFVAFAKS